jgi:hypothetical protein
MFECQLGAAEVELDDSQFQMQSFLLGASGHGEPLGQGVLNVFQGADLVRPLRQPLPEFGHHTAFELFSFHEKGLQID